MPSRADHAALRGGDGDPRRLLVSVVVPVRNGGSSLRDLMGTLEGQTLARERFEVIVADDGSTDGAAEGLGRADGWLRVDVGEPRNSYAARNRGARLAEAPVLAFCDADCQPDPEWLAAGLAALREADVVGGRIRFTSTRRPTIWALLDIDGYLNQEALVRTGGISTANAFVKRDVFREVGGFDESLPSGGDVDFGRRCVRSGATVVFDPAATVFHAPRETALAYLRKEWRIHRAFGERLARSAGTSPPRGARSPGPVVTTGRARMRGWLTHVPFLSAIRWRRAAGLPVRLDRRRLADAGVRPPLLRECGALVARYGFVHYFDIIARRRGHSRASRLSGEPR